MPEETQIDYKQNVGKTFTNGVVTAVVKDFHPKVLLNSKWVAAFLVDLGEKNVNRFLPVDTFLTEFTIKQ